ncbi:FKBP-type peptidyl-prolyl cis-trans isomerase [Pedobacter westerhofensis]|uniref:peptidylprolyl isomerase n=1 Tax=Pedobacter westerhofensis TaxID=425512 RepID=A0A521FRK1_9SPHI|nr:FKBP-type peptidyl-prolyl cis-trans isomerase [Pedobacter westerhofensis]SMO98855.1 FKBP-type peptidyl-prolyl cis-trans isomerase [Pedobacter westerhofensis]
MKTKINLNKCSLLIALILSTNICSLAVELKPLTVGDTLPNFMVKRIYNSDEKNLWTKEFNNKLLIVDFWSTYCSGCIAAFPRMEQLQNRFGDRIKILPVTYEKFEKIASFWTTNKYTKSLKLSTVVEDKLFNTYFPHVGVPHEVWIYQGKIVAITSTEYVDVPNIERILRGDKIDWAVKYDFFKYDKSQKLFNLKGSYNPKIGPISYVGISDYKPGVNSMGFSGGYGIDKDTSAKTIRTWFLNQPIHVAYVINWLNIYPLGKLVKPSMGVDSNQTVWEVRDRSKYRHNYSENPYPQEWVTKNAICFESIYPETGQNDTALYKRTILDLDRLLGLNVRWEKREENVWVLRCLKNSNNFGSYKVDKVGITADGMVSMLNNKEDHPYVFDETPIVESDFKASANLWMQINIKDPMDISSINEVIGKYDLKLYIEKRLVDKLIFTEIKGGLVIDKELQHSTKVKKLTQSNMSNSSEDESLKYLESNKSQKSVVVLPSGIQYSILKQGNGVHINRDSRILINYTGTQVNGKIFDSSLEHGRPIEIVVSNLIPGLQEALSLMSVGQRNIISIPAQLAYGKHTAQGKIPPNSTLIFDVEIVSKM